MEVVLYDGSTINSHFTIGAIIRIIMVIALMDGWVGNIVDVKGALLHGKF